MKKLLKRILVKLHLFEPAKWLMLQIKRCISKVKAAKLRRAFYTDFKEFFSKIDHAGVIPGGIVVVGILCTPHKPTLMTFLSKIQTILPQGQIVLLDEYRSAEITTPFLRLELPRNIHSRFDRFLSLPVKDEEEQLLSEKPFLQEAVINILSRNSNINRSYAKVLVCKTYQMYSKVIEQWKPSCVMIWSEYNALHTVGTQVCREKGIDPVFLEFGVLPGTFAMERGGQMGESGPALNWQEFRQLSVTDAQMNQAEHVLNYLKESRLNRNIQPGNDDMNRLKQRLKPGRPIVLFAGQKDFDSGMVPYNEHVRKYHSPSFATSIEAADYLASVAVENDWNFIFKPHPGMVTRYRKKRFAPNTIYVDSIDLNDLLDMVDVVVTIMSQTAYMSLIRERAVVMLGYNQLRGKGCTYEAFSLHEIENQVKAAITYGYTMEQRALFQLHTAQLLNYYLFDDLKERPIRYGRCSEQAIEIIA